MDRIPICVMNCFIRTADLHVNRNQLSRIHRRRIGAVGRRTGSPNRTRTRKGRLPKWLVRLAIARALVTDFGSLTASPELDSSLRLAAQDNHEIRAFAGLRAQRLVGDDQ